VAGEFVGEGGLGGGRCAGGDSEGELFQGDGDIDVDDGEGGMEDESDGGEVEDATDAGVDELLGDVLSGIGGDGDDADHHAVCSDGFLEVGEGLDASTLDGGTGEVGVVVEGGDDIESLAAQAIVAEDGSADVAGADDYGGPETIGAEDFSELLDEFGDAVAEAGLSELAEAGEVFSDLCVGEAKGLAELSGADGWSTGVG